MNTIQCGTRVARHRGFARLFEGEKRVGDKIFHIVKNSAVKQKLVFFGSYAVSMYNNPRRRGTVPDFDLLSPEPKHIGRDHG